MTDAANTADQQFQPGTRCLLVLMGRRFMVGILNVAEDSLRVSFPMDELPMDGMRVELEFHDERGYTRYETEVVQGPQEVGDGMVLRRPPASSRFRHRSSWRVPVGFRAELKGHVHPRRYEGTVRNISAGGALIKTKAAVDVGDNIEITLHLPNQSPEAVLGEVVHCPADTSPGAGRIGVRFISPDPTTAKILNTFVWKRLRELQPDRGGYVRRASDLQSLMPMRRKSDTSGDRT